MLGRDTGGEFIVWYCGFDMERPMTLKREAAHVATLVTVLLVVMLVLVMRVVVTLLTVVVVLLIAFNAGNSRGVQCF